MLSDGDAVAQAMDGVDARAATVWAQMSTIGVEATERLGAAATFVDAPVLGTTPAGRAGRADRARVRARARALPRRCSTRSAQDRSISATRPGTGQRMKLVLNHWVLALVEGVAETDRCSPSGWASTRQQFLEIIEGGAMFAPYAKLKGTNMIERSYEPSFSLKLARKDAGADRRRVRR